MPYRINPFSGDFDRVQGPGTGTAAIEFDSDSGSANPTGAGVITIAGGTGITTSASGSTVTIDASGMAVTWNEETGTSANMAVGNGYIANNAGLVTLTLPSTASIGDSVQVVGKGAGLFRIAQNAGQTIHYIASNTTTGVGGSLTAVEQYAAIELVCITANTDWAVLDSAGNFTVV